MTNETDRIQNAIRHIQTSVDIDPWAMEIAVKAMTKQMEDLKNSPTQMSETSDLISRQAAYNALVKHEESDGQHNYSMFRSVVSECEEIILDLPSAEPEQQWIPCERFVQNYRCKRVRKTQKEKQRILRI